MVMSLSNGLLAVFCALCFASPSAALSAPPDAFVVQLDVAYDRAIASPYVQGVARHEAARHQARQ